MAEKQGRKHNKPRRDVLLDQVVQFAECDVDELVATGRQTLRAVVEYGPAVVVVVSDAAHELESWRPSQLAQLQLRLRKFLRDAVALADADGGLIPKVRIDRLNFGIRPIRSASADVVVTVDGAAADVVLFQVVQLLQMVGAGRLLQCAAPECAKVFAKTGRREFCSATCQSRVYMRDLRQRERNARRRERGKSSRQR